MKNFIFLLTLFLVTLTAPAQNFEITSKHKPVKLITEGKSNRYYISPLFICSLDSPEYIVYHNWNDENMFHIDIFHYSRMNYFQNLATKQEKEARCEILNKSEYIALIELPDSITKISKSYTNEKLYYKCHCWYKYIDNLTDTIEITSSHKNMKLFYGYGGIGGKNKKPVIIFYH
ncbi:MAG: hypothetical protein IJW32_06075 [Clostridia bacterium]|nr:hypothetical protein [Alphaproteobacteria bacterium]MBQ9792567.1 hypothetical protein [Clostridia bacterium]MBQ9793281.1 hypothetical protein [Clostridia bacterium]